MELALNFDVGSSPTLPENQNRTRYPSVKSTFLLVPDQQGAELKRTHLVHCRKGNSMVNRDITTKEEGLNCVIKCTGTGEHRSSEWAD